VFIGLFIFCICTACKKNGGQSGGNESVEVSPTKALLIDTVKKLHRAHVEKDGDALIQLYLVRPEDEGRARKLAQKGWTDDNENLNTEGIALLEAKGKFAKLSVILPKKVEWAESRNIPADECYGLKLNGARIIAHWKNGTFRITHLDGAGSKLVRKMSSHRLKATPGGKTDSLGSVATSEGNSVTLPVGPFIANLDTKGPTRYLKLGFSLKVVDDSVKDFLQPRLDIYRDSVLTFLETLTIDDVLGDEGKLAVHNRLRALALETFGLSAQYPLQVSVDEFVVQ
jgi:flagellar basal body-associated protein FliL